MLPPDLRLRAATAQDVLAIAELADRCDRSYEDWLPGWEPPGVAAGAARWRHHLVEEPAGRWTRVAVDGAGRIVAMVSWSAAREDEGRGEAILGRAHVSAVFVDPSRWRQGIARAMLDAAVQAMIVAGYGTAQLHTPKGAPAEAFYRAHGWSASGEPHWSDELGMHMVLYERSLDA